ncbi:MAG: glutamate-5-semialdehyde dehydrogenase [Alphaproteobacteria bacterium]|jgi:glutamate-5-semialdehyde dehydrogenase|nr:glutamate-5-semialdehyde dehydrogenase [Alphaproteobacteria bacterium]
MSTAENSIEILADDLQQQMLDLGARARAAASLLAKTPAEAKNKALLQAAAAMRVGEGDILAANATDMAAAEQRDLTAALLDRLLLTEDRIEAMAKGLETVAELADPVGDVIADWDRPNGLRITRVRVPLGVIGIIYESRPNVTADAGAICLKSGNAAILRGGSESVHSSRAIHACLLAGLAAAGLPESAIQLLPTTDRAAVGMMLTMPQYIDIIVPRGGRGLIERVQNESRVPVIAHLDGNCHVYVDASADLAMARDISLNAKLRRTGICGASETLLVDRHCAGSYLAPLVKDLLDAGCEVRGDEDTIATDDRVVPATEDDWGTEYLDSIIAVKVVDGVGEAISHIENYGSQHTESIIADDGGVAERFLNEVDSAIVLHNASTQFADGGEFGMGAEIGISTNRLHARGPVGVEQLTSFKYVVYGQGQVRP